MGHQTPRKGCDDQPTLQVLMHLLFNLQWVYPLGNVLLH